MRNDHEMVMQTVSKGERLGTLDAYERISALESGHVHVNASKAKEQHWKDHLILTCAIL